MLKNQQTGRGGIMSWDEQIQRIVQKMELVRAKDADFTVFGASSHKYRMKSPISIDEVEAFERRNRVSIPQEFKLFLTSVGNGGAGPYYGIYSLGSNEDIYLSEPCRLHPGMTDEEWEELVRFDRDGVSDEQYDEEYDALFQGMLSLGTQGCTYEMMLIVNGEYRGRIVYIDGDLQKPFFTYEKHFLDWYERWLDEIIKGYNISWFGVKRGGDDAELIELFHESSDEKVQLTALEGMHKLPSITPETVDFLVEQAYHASAEIRSISIQLLAKYDLIRAESGLKQLLASPAEADQLAALQYIHWYAKEKEVHLFADQIKMLLPDTNDPDNFRFISYLLGKLARYELLVPFFYHGNNEIRKQAIYEVGKSEDKEIYLQEFIRCLQADDLSVKHTTVQALSNVTNQALLPYYKQILAEYKTDEHYIRTNVMLRLKEFESI